METKRITYGITDQEWWNMWFCFESIRAHIYTVIQHCWQFAAYILSRSSRIQQLLKGLWLPWNRQYCEKLSISNCHWCNPAQSISPGQFLDNHMTNFCDLWHVLCMPASAAVLRQYVGVKTSHFCCAYRMRSCVNNLLSFPSSFIDNISLASSWHWTKQKVNHVDIFRINVLVLLFQSGKEWSLFAVLLAQNVSTYKKDALAVHSPALCTFIHMSKNPNPIYRHVMKHHRGIGSG